MATTAWINKAQKKPKFMARKVRRCGVCGRVRGVYRKFKLCRICFRTMANNGEIPGVRKASW